MKHSISSFIKVIHSQFTYHYYSANTLMPTLFSVAAPSTTTYVAFLILLLSGICLVFMYVTQLSENKCKQLLQFKNGANSEIGTQLKSN